METTLTENDIREIIKAFSDREITCVEQVYKSAWDIDDRFILKQCGDLNELNKSVWFSEYLTGKCISVRTYLQTIDGKYYIEFNGQHYCLMNKIRGSHMEPFEGNRFDNGLLLGEIVAELHQALAGADTPFELYDAHYIDELRGWLFEEIKKNNLPVSGAIIQACLDFEQLYSKLPRQIIHRDMHLLNLVFENGRFAGYLDFDISQKNVRIFDLCYLGCSMLVGNYADDVKLNQWKEIFHGVCTGYNKRICLGNEEKEAIPVMFLLIELTFTAWYTMLGQPELAQSCVHMANWCYGHSDQIKSAIVP
jgi:Ser/Thr protein kinase RdoA (MazF antagonist)